MALAKRAKKHKKHEEHIDESWLVPYSDILTLLLALFIVLFASSSVDQAKLDQMSEVFNDIFSSGSGIMDNSAPVPNPNASSSEMNSQLSKYQQDQEALQEIQSSVEDFIAVNELENQFETSMTDEGLLITIRDSVLFEPGQATVKEEYLPIAKELADVITVEPDRHIIITGHTDNVPMNNEEFGSNWELSVMRAVNFLTILINNNAQLDGKNFSVKGFGEFTPIDTNDTAEGRAKNRRVEVLIQPKVTEDGSAYNSEK